MSVMSSKYRLPRFRLNVLPSLRASAFDSRLPGREPLAERTAKANGPEKEKEMSANDEAFVLSSKLGYTKAHNIESPSSLASVTKRGSPKKTRNATSDSCSSESGKPGLLFPVLLSPFPFPVRIAFRALTSMLPKSSLLLLSCSVLRGLLAELSKQETDSSHPFSQICSLLGVTALRIYSFNVAITRAQELLIICGNANLLKVNATRNMSGRSRLRSPRGIAQTSGMLCEEQAGVLGVGNVIVGCDDHGPGHVQKVGRLLDCGHVPNLSASFPLLTVSSLLVRVFPHLDSSHLIAFHRIANHLISPKLDPYWRSCIEFALRNGLYRGPEVTDVSPL